jgi:hypothetical protein
LHSQPDCVSFGPQELLAPLTTQDFLSDYWEKNFCHISGRGPIYYSKVFAIADVDAALFPVRQFVPEPAARAINSRKTETASDAGSLYQSFIDGSSINVNHIDKQFPSINRLCRKLEQLFHFPSGANLYLTPPHSQGFAAHYDRHEVFVLHISGEKRWDIWHPNQLLPLSDSTHPVPKDLGEPLARITLKPGDMLYLPRGWVHQAYSEDATTLHVSVRVEPFRWLDIAVEALRLSADRNEGLRRSLPCRFLDNPEASTIAPELLRDFMGPLVESCDITEALAVLGKQFTRRLMPLLDNRFETLGAIGGLSLESVIGKREGAVTFLEVSDEKVHIYFGGNVVSMPERVLHAINFIVANDTFSVKAIPGLDDASRLVVVRKLIKGGYLTFQRLKEQN